MSTKKKTKKVKKVSNKVKKSVLKRELLLELEGNIFLVEKEKGKVISREPLDGKICLEALLQVITEAVNKLER